MNRAAEFNVTVDFLIRQVSFLTERHAARVRAQMRRAAALTAARGSAAPSPIPTETNRLHTPQPHPQYAAEAMRRTGSGGQQRHQQQLSHGRRDSTSSATGAGGRYSPSTPPLPQQQAVGGAKQQQAQGHVRPAVSRTSSASTMVGRTGGVRTATTARPDSPASPRLPTSSKAGPSSAAAAKNRQRVSSLPLHNQLLRGQTPQSAQQSPAASTESDAASSSSESSSSESGIESRIIRRPPRFKPVTGAGVMGASMANTEGPGGTGGGGAALNGSDGDEDESDVAPAFLPTATTVTATSSTSTTRAPATSRATGLAGRQQRQQQTQQPQSRRLPASVTSEEDADGFSSSGQLSSPRPGAAKADQSRPPMSTASAAEQHRQQQQQQQQYSRNIQLQQQQQQRRQGQSGGSVQQQFGGPLSPRRAAELQGKGKGIAKGYSREGSDGSPSMGSSFSDLDGMYLICTWLLLFLAAY